LARSIVFTAKEIDMTGSQMRIIVAAASVGIGALCRSTASASEIAYFNFGSDTVNPTTAQSSSISPPAGVTVGTLGIDPLLTQGAYDTNGGGTELTALSYYEYHAVDPGDLVSSVSNHDDLQVTITPQAGQPLTITSIELDGFVNSNGQNTTPAIYIVDSINGTGAPDGTVLDEYLPGTPTTLNSFTGLSDLTAPVTFYFYSTGVGPYVDKGIHSLEIDGTVAAPEPTAIGLVAVASIGLMARRRRA
jgi:hypothetical protein